MDFFNWIRNLFTKNQELVYAAENSEYLPSIALETPEIADYANDNLDFAFPHWLSNEEALRDEGVIFGLSDTKADDKLKVIDNIFSKKTAFLDKKREELNEKIAEHNLTIEKNIRELENINLKSEQVKNQSNEEENLVRVFIGLFISIGMAAGVYYLIDESLMPAMPENHRWIAWGVFLVGMFSLYNPTALLHSKTEKMNWKNALEEFGVPLAASIFVFVQTLAFQPVYKALALFLFIFFAFMVSGKLMLSNIARLKYELKSLRKNIRLERDKNKIDTDWKLDKLEIEKNIDAIRIEKWKIVPELNRIEAELNQIKNEKEALISVFISEYQLANSYKNKMSKSQIKNILG